MRRGEPGRPDRPGRRGPGPRHRPDLDRPRDADGQRLQHLPLDQRHDAASRKVNTRPDDGRELPRRRDRGRDDLLLQGDGGGQLGRRIGAVRRRQRPALPTPSRPRSPTGLVAASAGSGIQLNWSANTEPDLLGYRIYKSDSADRHVPRAQQRPDGHRHDLHRHARPVRAALVLRDLGGGPLRQRVGPVGRRPMRPCWTRPRPPCRPT